MLISNLANLPEKDFAELKSELVKHKTLGRALEWAGAQPKRDFSPRIVSEVVTQDEYTHDVVIPYKNIFLVYDTT